MPLKNQTALFAAGLLFVGCTSFSQETLPPLKDGSAPQTDAELWADFDPRAEPLDVEILKDDRSNTTARFWYHAGAVDKGGTGRAHAVADDRKL